jgi:TatD DNase family protein
MKFVDSHCHLDFPDLYQHIDVLLQNMENLDVAHALCVCVRLEDAQSLLDKINPYPQLSASIGVHPDYDDNARQPTVEELIQWSAHPKVCAIGETGLDYFRLDNSGNQLDWQRERFINHIEAAKTVQKPLIVHTREAREDTLAILREHQADKCLGVLHCFTESYEMAKAAIDLGFYISFSGIVSFKNAKDLQETAKKLPLDAILIETDAPYLAPMPHRGKTNQPAWVRHVAEYLAILRDEPLTKIAAQTTANFERLFGIKV